ncbi:replication factor A protein 3-domain-containing protein [Hypoxylon sp. NC1633]|nr:replication factor A protein 3-domain-containing protein [Hypoxylon sp. NC1633]
MEPTSTPRISAALVDSFVGHNVMIVGKVVQLRGDTAFLEADGQVQANLNRDCHLMVGNGAQIIGKVNPDLTIKVLNAIDLGNNVDFQLCQNVVDVTHQFKDIFVYPDRESSSFQQSQSQPQFLSQPAFEQKQKISTAADFTTHTPVASTSASVSTSSSQSSRRSISPPIDQLSQLSIQEETPQSSQSITEHPDLYSIPSAQPDIHSVHPSQFSILSTQQTQYTEEASSSHRQLIKGKSMLPTPQSSQQQQIPTTVSLPSKDTRSSSRRHPSPTPPPEISSYPPSSPITLSSPFPQSQRRGRLFRTRSGNLRSGPEIRRRRETERHAEELLDMILEGFRHYEDDYDSERRPNVVAFALDEVGRWRIARRDLRELELYENA